MRKNTSGAKGADLLIVAVKYGSLEGSLDAIEQIVDDETIVMSVMNGVDSEEIIGHRIGMQHMMYSMIKSHPSAPAIASVLIRK